MDPTNMLMIETPPDAAVSASMQMSPLESLPGEIVIRIAEMLCDHCNPRGAPSREETEREYWIYPGPTPGIADLHATNDLFSLCLASKELNRLVMPVLYHAPPTLAFRHKSRRCPEDAYGAPPAAADPRAEAFWEPPTTSCGGTKRRLGSTWHKPGLRRIWSFLQTIAYRAPYLARHVRRLRISVPWVLGKEEDQYRDHYLDRLIATVAREKCGGLDLSDVEAADERPSKRRMVGLLAVALSLCTQLEELLVLNVSRVPPTSCGPDSLKRLRSITVIQGGFHLLGSDAGEALLAAAPQLTSLTYHHLHEHETPIVRRGLALGNLRHLSVMTTCSWPRQQLRVLLRQCPGLETLDYRTDKAPRSGGVRMLGADLAESAPRLKSLTLQFDVMGTRSPNPGAVKDKYAGRSLKGLTQLQHLRLGPYYVASYSNPFFPRRVPDAAPNVLQDVLPSSIRSLAIADLEPGHPKLQSLVPALRALAAVCRTDFPLLKEILVACPELVIPNRDDEEDLRREFMANNGVILNFDRHVLPSLDI